MRNLRLTLAYDGTDFHGWQRQPSAPTIQECLESAIERLLGERVVVYGSGRTDAGVHAMGQVASLKTQLAIPCQNLVKALNDLLPPTVRIKDAREVPDKFHARYDVGSKTYRYRILQAPFCSPFVWRFVWHYPYLLDRTRMAPAARLIEGKHDFTSLAASVGEGLNGSPEDREHHHGAPIQDSADAVLGTSAPAAKEDDNRGGMVRTIFSSQILWRPRTQVLIYEVRGSGFLHHMVRNIVGTLVEVGKGRLAPEDVGRILEARDRRLAGPTAPAQGLCLVQVEY
jgi:tRNA pseudouridine38-40 synthase